MEDESTFKIILTGNTGVGKTSLLCRFAERTFQDDISEFEMKKRAVTVNGKTYTLALFDTAGQERFRTLTSGFYNNTHGAILVYDVTDEQSYIDIPNWLRDVNRYTTDPVRMILANKTDLGASKVDREEVASYADANRCSFYEVSAKEGTNTEEAFMHLVEELVEKRFGQKDEAPAEKEPKGCCTLM